MSRHLIFRSTYSSTNLILLSRHMTPLSTTSAFQLWIPGSRFRQLDFGGQGVIDFRREADEFGAKRGDEGAVLSEVLQFVRIVCSGRIPRSTPACLCR